MKTILNLFSFLLVSTALLGSGIDDGKKDFIFLQNGDVLEGDIKKMKKNSFVIEISSNDYVKVKNENVGIVAFSDSLTERELYRLGELDGKRFATGQGANFMVGFVFGIIGTAIVYGSGGQEPSKKVKQGRDSNIIEDINYREGYARGSSRTSGSSALTGTIVSLAGLLIALFAI